MRLIITTLAERPELADQLWTMPQDWPTFTENDPLADLYYDELSTTFAPYTLVCTEVDRPAELAAKAHLVPFRYDGDELPADGWDGAVRRGWLTRRRGHQPNRISALEITIRPDLRGRGLSGVILDALRRRAAVLGFAELLAPVRPTGRSAEQATPMSEYAYRVRDDGLPTDPWLRVHVRAGGRIDSVAPRSMVIPGTLADWRAWTGLPFDVTGPVQVPGGLVPVHCDVEQDFAVYVEPNVWVRHALTAAGK